MKKILCHACCAVCSLFPLQKMKQMEFDPVIYFYNPNIYPKAEYDRRLKELKKYCDKKEQTLIVEEDSPLVWDKAVEGYEKEPERGERCKKCFYLRLEKTAQYAKKHNFDIITTTLTVSPHKKSKDIFEILDKITKKYNLEYLPCDFKKENGFLTTSRLADKEEFYRQKYCGCKYSIRSEIV